MVQTRVLTSLGELATVRGRFADDARPGPVPPAQALVPVIGASDPETIAALAATAQAAIDELEALAVADRTEREAAAAGLAQWRRLTAAAQRCETLAAQLGGSRRRAEALAAAAVTDDARGRAAAVAATCGRLGTQASAHAAALHRAAAAVAARAEVGRLLAAERQAEAAAAARLRRRVADQEAQAAAAVLRDARRIHRREPVAALTLLEPLTLEGLPDELARHLYGLWLTVCRRFGLLAAVHYRAGAGRGAVLIPAPDGDWEVVSAIGLRRWPRGRRLAASALRGARPLG